ncbi:short chain dehydrogenase [Colletotrichum karsti]|uniref:Short chain dehydrogenase n=1 Tax=Colletotrichum karsti TaxID=1095194 RepID=A0A9P6IDQ9_9PEZI|nr:short chain dehydrogenase [Colletotrichum karsti]KAF9881532.1 short chain dehydrogenase [Colletotrichum karsti]
MEAIASRKRSNPPRDASPNALAGKVALVTGSTTGIGAAVVRELSARGASVVINYGWPDLRGAAEEIGQSLSSPWIAVEADLSTTDGPAKLVAATVEKFGKVDILVNNAAKATLAKVEETSIDLWDASMNTNVRGAFLLSQAVLPHLPPKAEGGGGRIINITSAVATDPEILQTAYATSKGAITTLTRCLAKELPPTYGCTVNAVSPGIVKTPQFLGELQKMGNAFLTQIFDARTPVDGWIGLPEDIAFAVAFLAEDRASWVNGASINVSGGMFFD